MDEIEGYEFFIDLVPKTTFDKLGYYVVFKQQDTEGDGVLDPEEMYDALVKLTGDHTKVNTFDQVKKAIVNNLK